MRDCQSKLPPLSDEDLQMYILQNVSLEEIAQLRSNRMRCSVMSYFVGVEMTTDDDFCENACKQNIEWIKEVCWNHLIDKVKNNSQNMLELTQHVGLVFGIDLIKKFLLDCAKKGAEAERLIDTAKTLNLL